MAGAQRVATSHFDRHSVWLQNSIRGAAGLAVAVLLPARRRAERVLDRPRRAVGAPLQRPVDRLDRVAGVAGHGDRLRHRRRRRQADRHQPRGVVDPAALGHPRRGVGAGDRLVRRRPGRVHGVHDHPVQHHRAAGLADRGHPGRGRRARLPGQSGRRVPVLAARRRAALGAAYAEAYRTSAVPARVDRQPGRPRACRRRDGRGRDGGRQPARRRVAAVPGRAGRKQVPLESVAALANGATRLRLAGSAIASLQQTADGSADDDRLDEPVEVLPAARTRSPAGTPRSPTVSRSAAPGCHRRRIDDRRSFLDVVLPAVERCGDPTRPRAEQLLWSGQYLGDVDHCAPICSNRPDR